MAARLDDTLNHAVEVRGLLDATRRMGVRAIALTGHPSSWLSWAHNGFSVDEFAWRHPGGKIWRRRERVDQLMHRDAGRPLVRAETPLNDVIYEMSRKATG